MHDCTILLDYTDSQRVGSSGTCMRRISSWSILSDSTLGKQAGCIPVCSAAISAPCSFTVGKNAGYPFKNICMGHLTGGISSSSKVADNTGNSILSLSESARAKIAAIISSSDNAILKLADRAISTPGNDTIASNSTESINNTAIAGRGPLQRAESGEIEPSVKLSVRRKISNILHHYKS